MNKKIHLLLLSLISSSLFAKDHTDKTFIQTKSHLYNMALEQTTWHTQLNKIKSHKWTPSLQAVGFFQRSENKADIGKYFGTYARNEEVIRDYISVVGHDDAGALVPNDIDAIKSEYIIHYPSSEELNFNFGGKIKLAPYQESYGVRFDYHQKLGSFFFKADLPIVHLENHINDHDMGALTPFDYNTADPRYGKTLADYLKGKVNSLNPTDEEFSAMQQDVLKYAKIDGTREKTGVSDLALKLGYNFLHKHGNHMGLYVASTIPTSSKSKAEYLFEPVLGNGKHWGLGGGVDSKFRIWNKGHDSIELLIIAEGQYLFENDQKRTLGLLDDNGHVVSFGQYYLAGKKDELPVSPAANFLTQEVKVKRGMQGNVLAGFAFNAKNFTFDLGYELYAVKGEHINLKHDWDNTLYALANKDYHTEGLPLQSIELRQGYDVTFGPFDPTNVYHYIDTKVVNIQGPIKETNLNLDSVKTPMQVTHKIYGGIGYSFNEWRTPLMLGLGTSYEFASGNNDLENWTIWAKLGLSF